MGVKRRRALVVTFVGVGLVAGAVLLRDRSGPGDGPLDGGVGTVQGQPLEVGAPYTWGSVLLTNEGKKPAVVERVRLLGVTGSFELLAVHTRPVPDERGQGYILGEDVFPSEQYPTKPLAEQNVVPVAKTRTPAGTPGEGLQIVFGLQVGAPGVARSRAAEVTYRVHDRRYREVYHDEIYLCAPFEAYDEQGQCPSEEVRGRFDDRTLG